MSSNHHWSWQTPGSGAAQHFGCCCPVLDNHRGYRGLNCPSAGWIIAKQCPLHGEQSESNEGQPFVEERTRVQEPARDEAGHPNLSVQRRWPGPARSRKAQKPVTEPAFKTYRCTAQRELYSKSPRGGSDWTSSVQVPAFELWAADEERAEQKARRILGRVKHQVALHVTVAEV